MPIAKFINQILAHFGVSIMKSSTRNQLLSTQSAEGYTGGVSLLDFNGKVECSFNVLLQHQVSTKWDLIDYIEKHQAPIDSVVCPLCEYANDVERFNKYVSACIFGGGTLIRHQCPECDVIFGPEKILSLSEAELSRDYEWHYRIYTEGDSTTQEVRAFHALKPRKEGIYLNWGAGSWSKTIEVLRNEGWNVFGFEPHSSASLDNPYIISNKEQLLTMRFDGIFSNNVLEHLRYPIRELSEMRDLLQDGGKMSHSTPCFEYRYEYTRFHLFFFLGRSRPLLAKKTKLNITDFIVDDEFMNLILTKVQG